jgi:hypothetical protein
MILYYIIFFLAPHYYKCCYVRTDIFRVVIIQFKKTLGFDIRIGNSGFAFSLGSWKLKLQIFQFWQNFDLG